MAPCWWAAGAVMLTARHAAWLRCSQFYGSFVCMYVRPQSVQLVVNAPQGLVVQLGPVPSALSPKQQVQVGNGGRIGHDPVQVVERGHEHDSCGYSSLSWGCTRGLHGLMGPHTVPVLQVPISVTATAPFLGPPPLLLVYVPSGSSTGSAVQVDLRLPLWPHKFVTPEPAIPKEYFFEQWKALR